MSPWTSHGNAIIYSETSWGTPIVIDPNYFATSVSCTSSSFCVAVDNDGRVIKYGTTGWGTPASLGLSRGGTSVSCTSSSFCVATDSTGQATTYDGSSWSVPVQADSYAAIVNEVSCASSSFCVAVDAENYAFVFAPTTAAITTSTSHPRLGQSISIGVKVSGRPRGVGAKTPTGKVIVKEASTTLCVTALSTGKGSCRLSTRRLGAGKYHLAATYSGSADYGRSVSRPTTLTVAKAISATVLKLSTAKLTEGSEQAEHLSVTVSPQHAGLTPTGKVTVKEAAAALCVIKLSTGKGSCRLSTRRLGAGKYHLVATYSGSADFGSSASASKTLTVTK